MTQTWFCGIHPTSVWICTLKVLPFCVHWIIVCRSLRLASESLTLSCFKRGRFSSLLTRLNSSDRIMHRGVTWPLNHSTMSQAHKSNIALRLPAGLKAKVDFKMQHVHPCDATPVTKQLQSSFFSLVHLIMVSGER